MTRREQAIQAYLEEGLSKGETTDVNLAAADLHVLFPRTSIEDLAGPVWDAGVEMGASVTRKSRPPGSV
jgi:hypothetical protein